MAEPMRSERVGQACGGLSHGSLPRSLLICSSVAVLIALTAGLVYFWRQHTPEAQLRAIDAARAIPDERNAPTILRLRSGWTGMPGSWIS
jgi:hypothetical protein